MKYKVGDARVPERLHYRQGLQLEEIPDCKTGSKDREQCSTDYGAEACRSELSVS